MYTGMGSTGTAIVGTGGAIGAEVVKDTSAFGLFAAGSVAVPIIGAAIAGVTTLITVFMARNAQYHAQESATTKIVDQAEQLMKQNLDAWNASSKTQAEQQQAIANFQNIWAQVVQACNRPEFADPGQRCIHDRERGGQWPWPEYYLDTIANDPNVQPDPVTGAFSSVGQAISQNPLPALLVAALVIAAVAS